ncbi:MAG TPA: tRNA (guanosine(37)-N1)-methyltransferase TrmD [Firmicutes bacterium]|nr:tRNA (guanosine(37)-N1)-methyltransferase TrmD [Bacillota bacterium]
MRIDILTLFPEMCEAVLGESIIGRAQRKGAIEIKYTNFRDYTDSKHGTVDDYPYGGGAGMLLRAQPIYDAFMAICAETETRPHLIYMSPQGKTLTQARAHELSKLNNIAILCGHYEGVDERLIEEIVDEEISIGDFVLTGGELPAMVLVDCIARHVDGVLSSEECYKEDSHFSGLIEYPQYTRPASWRGREVPGVLLSGHHANIEKWRREQSLVRTLSKRPDILKTESLSEKDKEFLKKFSNI